MDSVKFLLRHGDKWPAIKADLIEFLDSRSPAHQADKLPIASTKEARETVNQDFTAILSGYAAARRVINELGVETPESEPDEPTFAKSAEEMFRVEHTEQPMPTMPAPKQRRKKK